MGSTPFWVHGENKTAPAEGTSLVGFQISPRRVGKLYGWYIVCPEANEFILYIGDVGYRIAAFASAGVIYFTSDFPLFDNIEAGLWISILNVSAGGAGKVYRASLLVDQVA